MSNITPDNAAATEQQVSLSRLQMFYGDMGALPLLRAMILEEFAGKIGIVSSFGAEAALMLSLISEIDKDVPVLFLETQKHFPETIAYTKTLSDVLGLTNVHMLAPDPALVQQHDADGQLWSVQPSKCCWMRKVEPLNRAIKELGIRALITGRKRYQTPERANMQTIELDDQNIFRINPVAAWDKSRVKREVAARDLPKHPLIDKGYLSIGCAPCTKPVAEGEDERAGRWAHTVGLEEEQKTECGIHLPAADMNWSV